jgi:nuclear pore complex protein Nup85
LINDLSFVYALIIIRSGLSLRDEYILTYADYLHSDPALWRITVDYMYSCGEIGKCRADDILLRVPLRLHEQNSDIKVDSRIRAGEVVGVLKDVNATCFEYRRENVRRTVCRVSPSLSQFFSNDPYVLH